jgi:hypothetical protein
VRTERRLLVLPRELTDSITSSATNSFSPAACASGRLRAPERTSPFANTTSTSLKDGAPDDFTDNGA